MLDAILESTSARVAALAADSGSLRSAAASMTPPRDFAASLTAPGLQIIAEIKRRSPSAGLLAPDLDPAAQAMRYAAGGAAAISVLTEPDFFDGSMDDLLAVRATVELPILRKDFIIDPIQVAEARAAGADAVLLIVAALTDARLDELLGAATEWGLAAVVEAHTREETERAMTAGAEIVGVNNRDLATFATDISTAEALRPVVATASVSIAESGVSDVAAARRMAAAGYDAILVGEALVRAQDPASLIRSLREASS